MTSETKLQGADRFTRWLIRGAARRAPDALSERLEEEWLANLSDLHGTLARLRFALGCCWATNVITRDYELAAAPAAPVPATLTRLIGFGQQSFSGMSRRTITFLMVVGLHGVMFYLFVSGLGVQFVKIIPTTFQTRVIDAPHPRALPPPPPPQLSPTKIEVSFPEVPPVESDSRNDVDATAVDPKQSAGSSAIPPELRVVHRVSGGPGNGFPSADDFYPLLAIQLGETGVATVRACVDGAGRLTSDPTIVQSTHSARLDEGALKLARAGSGHYRPTMEDGQPVKACYPFRIRFDLKN